MSQAIRTSQYRIVMPWEGATRMTCADANCQNRASGWATVLDPTDTAGAKQATMIDGSGRRFIKLESATAEAYLAKHAKQIGVTVTPHLRELLQRTPAGMLVFLFPPGQECFKRHLDREVTFLHDRRVHEKPRDFTEDHNEGMYAFWRRKQRG